MNDARRRFLKILLGLPIFNLIPFIRQMWSPPADVVMAENVERWMGIAKKLEDVSVPGVGEQWSEEWPHGRAYDFDYVNRMGSSSGIRCAMDEITCALVTYVADPKTIDYLRWSIWRSIENCVGPELRPVDLAGDDRKHIAVIRNLA
jgi:hypothetical protein